MLVRVGQNGHLVIPNPDDHSNFVLELAAADDLDVVTLPELLAQILDRRLHSPSTKRAVFHADCDQIAVDLDCTSSHTLLFTTEKLDIVARLEDRTSVGFECSGQSCEIQALTTLVSASRELGNFFQ